MNRIRTHEDGTLPDIPNCIWVFGSNLAGYHGAGAALVAYMKFGAKAGVAQGLSDRSYAIPTKNDKLKTLSKLEISGYVDNFCRVTHNYKDLFFFVTRVGCGLAGYDDYEIAPMFKRANYSNCSFSTNWRKFL
jgi:hypothetical protein